MFIYKAKQKFNPDSGQPDGYNYIKSGIVCDYTGVVIDKDNDEQYPWYSLSISYCDRSEPLWYEDFNDLKKTLNLEIDYSCFFNFMESPYHFVLGEDEYGLSDVSKNMIHEWINHLTKKSGKFFQCRTLEDVLLTVRISLVKKLLVDKTYILDQLIPPPPPS